MSEARAPSSGAPSASLCPGCGKAIDPLRAGQVAIVDGRFSYFCNTKCKQTFMIGRASGMQDAATAEPPPVRSGERSVEPRASPISADAKTTLPAPATDASPDAETEADAGDIANPRADADAALHAPPPPAFPPPSSPPPVAPAERASTVTTSEPPPATLRSPASSAKSTPSTPPRSAPASIAPPPNAVERPPRGWHTWSALAGILAGAASPALSLVGAAPTARVLLACAAVGALLARVATTAAPASDPHPILRVSPTLVPAALALWRISLGDARAASLGAFAGVAAAAALVVELVLERAREPIDRARKAIAQKLAVEARVMRGAETVIANAAEARPGEKVLVEAGQTIGVDGVVVAGEASVIPWLEAPIEIKKVEGDAVVAGARVVSGSLRVNTTWSGADRAWLKHLANPAGGFDATAPFPRAVRRALERATPIAAAAAAVAGWASNASWVEMTTMACGAAVATLAGGVAAAVGLGHARAQLTALSHGVVYKDPVAFDRAGHVEIAVLCSRGTVLMGEPEIVALEPLGTADESRVLALAAGAETASTHPFAAAVLRAARARGVRPDTVRSANVHAGLGVTALASTGERIVVGSRALLLQEKISVAVADARVGELEAQGRSVLLVAAADRVVGLVALQDGLRPGARAAVQRLLNARIEPVLLSGEARETCETIGRALDIEHVRPEVLPSDRGGEVKALGEGGRAVAVLGHATGDDGALGAADVSIALSAAGAAPGEWSVALATDDARDGALALSLAHDARARSRAALVGGLVPSGFALLALVFAVGSPLLAPAAAVIGTLLAISRVRE